MISTSLRAAAAYVDANASSTAWDSHQRLSDEQRFAKRQRVEAVAMEIRVLADASEARKVRYPEYQVLKERLYALGLSLPLTLDQDVAVAFREAQSPAQPREKGWLKQP